MSALRNAAVRVQAARQEALNEECERWFAKLSNLSQPRPATSQARASSTPALPSSLSAPLLGPAATATCRASTAEGRSRPKAGAVVQSVQVPTHHLGGLIASIGAQDEGKDTMSLFRKVRRCASHPLYTAC